MSIRAEALTWWKNLSKEHQIELAKRYYPEKDFIVITTSSQKIELMYRFVELDEEDL